MGKSSTTFKSIFKEFHEFFLLFFADKKSTPDTSPNPSPRTVRSKSIPNGNSSLDPVGGGGVAPIARSEDVEDETSGGNNKNASVTNGGDSNVSAYNKVNAGKMESNSDKIVSSTPIKKNWRNSLVLNRSSGSTPAASSGSKTDKDENLLDPPWWSDEDDDEKTDRTAGSLNNNNSNGNNRSNGAKISEDGFEFFSSTEEEEEDGDQTSLDSMTTSR